jgi:hypothetical protein
MRLPGSSLCRSCGAEVFWLKHEKTGKPAPINVGGDLQGNITVSLGDGTYRVEARARLEEMRAEIAEREAGAPSPHVLHTNHFQTCPSAGAWKRHGGSGFRGPRNSK